MSFKKRILAVAAAGALGALTAVPAMAFENEFHGIYKLKYFLSNYEGYTGNDLTNNGPILYGPTPSKPVSSDTTENLKTKNYFEQRARIFYTAKASDDLKLVTGFEIDSMWGDTAQGGTTRNNGGALESDSVNLETKWVYLDFKIPTTRTKVTAGIQAFKDSLKGIFFDFDGAGIMTSSKLDPLTLNIGYIRGYDESFFSTSLPKGQQNLDIGVVEAKMALNKDMNVGAVYYLYADGRGLTGLSNGATKINTTSIMLHTLGLTADAKVGILNLSGFAAYQSGVFRNIDAAGNSAYSNALAYNVAAKAAVGPGTLKTALLFTSGQGDVTSNHLTGWIGTSQSKDRTWSSTAGTSTYNESGLFLLNRNSAAQASTTDASIVYNTGNGTNPLNMQGVYLFTLGYDATITPKLYTNVNLGAAWVAKNNGLKPTDKSLAAAVVDKRNACNYMGSEINFETGYKMYDNLTAYVQAAYVVLGGYYKNSVLKGDGKTAADPENPYTARLGLSYAF